MRGKLWMEREKDAEDLYLGMETPIKANGNIIKVKEKGFIKGFIRDASILEYGVKVTYKAKAKPATKTALIMKANSI